MMLRIITQDNCVFCDQAKDLMVEKGIIYSEFPASGLTVSLLKKAGLKTVPQIFTMDHEYIGGFNELKEYLTNQEK